MELTLRNIEAADKPWIEALAKRLWAGRNIVSRGKVYDLLDAAGFVATRNGQLCGHVTYRIQGDECEILSLAADPPHAGGGTALLDAAVNRAREAECRRVWLITTNDNLDAFRFYQRRGFVLARVHPNALSQSRRLKPSIPMIGNHGIPLRDEIELEMKL